MYRPAWIGFALSLWLALEGHSQTNDAWTRKAFLGDFEHDPEVNQLLRNVTTKRTYDEGLAEVQSLKKIRSDRARAALLRIAYGEIGQQYVKRATSVYVSLLEDKSQARALLAASDLDVLESGFRELCGQPLDEALLARAATAVTNDSLGLRWNIARLLQMDTNVVLAERKATLILGCIRTTLTCSGAKGLQREPEGFFEDGLPRGESHLWRHAALLGRTKGVTVQMIREALGAERGVVRDFGLLAMAYAGTPAMQVPFGTVAERKAALIIYATNEPSFFRGDQAVCAELYGVLTNSPNVTARFAAMSFLSWRPQQCDRAALEWVAAQDPFKSRPTPRYFMMPGADRTLEDRRDAKIYPLRILAQESLRALDARKNPPALEAQPPAGSQK